MKLSKTMKKVMAYVCAITLVVAGISKAPTIVKAADTFEGISQSITETGGITVSWTAYPDNWKTVDAYILEGEYDTSATVTEGDAARCQNPDWVWNTQGNEYGGANANKADNIGGNANNTLKVTRGKTYTVILVAYTGAATGDRTAEITREAVVVTVPELTEEESRSLAEKQSIEAAEEASRAAAAAAIVDKFKTSFAYGKGATYFNGTTNNLTDADMGNGFQLPQQTSVDNSWFYVDFGETKKINTVSTKWEAALPSSYDIYAGTSLENMQKVASQDGVTAETIVTTTFDEVDAQFVKIQSTELSGLGVTWGIQAREIGVFYETAEETTVEPEVTTTVEETTAETEETTAETEETTVAPEETTVAPEETTVAPEETTVAPEEMIEEEVQGADNRVTVGNWEVWLNRSHTMKFAVDSSDADHIQSTILNNNNNWDVWSAQYIYSMDGLTPGAEYTLSVDLKGTGTDFRIFNGAEYANAGQNQTEAVATRTVTADGAGKIEVIFGGGLVGIGIMVDFSNVVVTDAEGKVVYPAASEETTVAPEETTVAPEETTVAPEETTVAPEPTTAATVEYDWVALGNGIGAGGDNFYYDKNSISGVQEMVNVQSPGWATEPGIYTSYPAGVSKVLVNGVEMNSTGIQGAGVLVLLSALTKNINEVSVEYAGGSASFLIKNDNVQPEVTTAAQDETTTVAQDETTTVAQDETTTVEVQTSEAKDSRNIGFDVADSYLNGWTGSSSSMSAENNSATVTISKTGWSEGDNSMWAIQAKSEKVKVTPGETYKYSATIVSDTDKEVYVKVSTTDGTNAEIAGKRLELKANEPQSFVIEGMTPTVEELQVVYALGTMGSEQEKTNLVVQITGSALEGKEPTPEVTTSEVTTEEVTTAEVTTAEVTTAEVTTAEVTTAEVTTAEVTAKAPTTTKAAPTTKSFAAQKKAFQKKCGKAKIKTATKKKSAKKIQIKLKKKLKGVDGYIVRIFKSKKTAKKNKGYIKKVTIKKNKKTFTVKGKNKKKLYVRVIGYKKIGKTKVLAKKWSSPKRVKIR